MKKGKTMFLGKHTKLFFVFTAVLILIAGCTQPQASNSNPDNSDVQDILQIKALNDSEHEEITNDTDFEQDFGTEDNSLNDFELEQLLEEDIAEIDQMEQDLENELSELEDMYFEMTKTEQEAAELETPDPQDFE